MAHVHKRRRLEKLPDHDSEASYNHIAQGSSDMEAPLLQSLRTPPRIDEIHVRIRSERAEAAASERKIAAHRALHRRQLTGSDPATITAVTTSSSSGTAAFASAASQTSTGNSTSGSSAGTLVSAMPSASVNSTNGAFTLSSNNSTILASAAGANATSASFHSFSNSSVTSFGLYVTTLSNGVVETLTSSEITTTTSASDTAGGLLSAATASAATTADGTSATATSGASSTSSAADSGSTGSVSSDSSTNPPASIIAGGVVGGVAGIAIIALIALLFLRWYKRKSGQQRLTDEPHAPTDPPISGSGAPGMAQRAGMLPWATTAATMFGRSHDSENAATSERGFQRLSGRKLPSAFSGGITAPPDAYTRTRPAPMPAAFSNGSDNSNGSHGHESAYLRDSAAFGHGDSASSHHSDDAPIHAELRPGPSRTPTLHPGGPYHFAENPFQDPPSMPVRAGTPIDFGRDVGRGRFTEDV